MFTPYVKPVGSLVREAIQQGRIFWLKRRKAPCLIWIKVPTLRYQFMYHGRRHFQRLGHWHSTRAGCGRDYQAFQTRVGAGPFPTELFDETSDFLRGSGTNPWDEFGTTTGRPRRVGWLDLMLLKYAIAVNGATELFLTKMDILSASMRSNSALPIEKTAVKSTNWISAEGQTICSAANRYTNPRPGGSRT